MTNRCRLRKTLCVFVLALLTWLTGWLERATLGYSTGPPAAHAGAPGEANCMACHNTYALNSGAGELTLSGLPAVYQAGQEIELTVTLAQTGQRRFGIQLVALNHAGEQAGTLIITDAARTQLQSGAVSGQQRLYLEHTQTGSLPTQSARSVWQFKWLAPPLSTGRVTVYLAGNAANGSYTTAGDYIYTRAYTIEPASAPSALATVSAASFSAAPLAAEAIVAAFGTGLASETQVANTTPLPTILAGTAVQVRDSQGIERAAPLFFVSPNQINYQVPAGTAAGEALVTVSRAQQIVGLGRLPIERLAPGLFSANANGFGWAAAVALRVRADGTQQFEAVAQFDAGQNRFIATPLDLGPAGDQLYLVAFGTGFRTHLGVAQIKAEFDSRAAEVLFAGAQGQLVGLDQLNLRLPRELAGRGELELSVEFEHHKTNKVKIYVK
jgi:uncharacterized protein (TIGR03437 family)